MAGKKLGKRAMLLGALAQSLPDIDFTGALWNDPASNLLAHRGFTHSLLFAILATFLLALLANHYSRKHRMSNSIWLIFFGVQIGTHLFLDLFNSYGMGLLEPFSHKRFSFNAIFVADPFLSVWPAVAFVALLILKIGDRRRRSWWRVGVMGSLVYLLYCTTNKIIIDHDVKKILAAQRINSENYFTTPAPLNNWLWYVVVKDSQGYDVAYRSVFDKNKNLDFHYFPQNDSLLDKVRDHADVQQLLRFSQGYYTVEKWHDTLVFNDLRFGQMIGWHHPEAKFVFHYFLQPGTADNRLVVQRGRFANWSWESTRSLWNKIKGN